MEVSNDLYENIFFFLSSKEKILVREVCQTFKQNIKWRVLIAYKLNNNLRRVHCIEMKLANDLILTTNDNFIMYTENKTNGMNRLFIRKSHQYNKCIVDKCREKTVGFIYYNKTRPSPNYHKYYYWNFYDKRNIPYCLGCFNKV